MVCRPAFAGWMKGARVIPVEVDGEGEGGYADGKLRSTGGLEVVGQRIVVGFLIAFTSSGVIEASASHFASS